MGDHDRRTVIGDRNVGLIAAAQRDELPPPSLGYLVGRGEQRRRHGQAENRAHPQALRRERRSGDALVEAADSIQNISGLPQGPAGTFRGNLGVR
jgi:hypothetical protein